MPEYKTIAQYTPSNLIAGDFPLVTDSITVALGQNLKEGAVLGQVKSNGQYVLSQSDAKDGSENPTAVLAGAVDTTNGETQAVCFLSGQFKAAALTFGTGHTVESLTPLLRKLNIYII